MHNQVSTPEADSILRPAPFPPNLSSPIFVLGSVRSGTSAVGQALTRGAGIPGHAEGHVSTLLQMTLAAVDRVTGNFPASGGRYLLDELDASAFKLHIRNYFAAFFASKCPAGVWADKSPDDFEGAPAIRSAPLLLELFPNARFVYCLRRGIENVLSRTTKFPQVPFWYHCRSWATTVLTWHEVRPLLRDRWIEVRQEDLALRPAKVAQELGAFLGLDAAQLEGLQRCMELDRPEQSRPAGEARELSMEEAGWDPGLQGVFLKECERAMQLAGYGLGSRTHDESQGLRLFWATSESSSSTELRGVPADRHRALNRFDFTLGPGPIGTRAILTYRDMAISGRDSFSSRLRVDGPADALVEFGFEVRNAASQVVASGTGRARGGATPTELRVQLPSGNLGICTVTISTELIEGHDPAAIQAEWLSPAFQG